MKSILVLAVLFGLAVAQPYASVISWYANGCNATANNYVYDAYVYPADGSCFVPSGGYYFYSSYGYRITFNDTAVNVTEYVSEDCTSTPYTDWYPRDNCPSDDDVVVSIWDDFPPEDYWGDQEFVGVGDEPWETILITNYYDAVDCPDDSWISTQIQGWEECDTGIYFYCDDSQIHYDACTDLTDCASGCLEVYEPLDDDCTASVDAPSFWSGYIDYTTSTSYQATCVGGSSSGSTLIASVAVVVAALALVF